MQQRINYKFSLPLYLVSSNKSLFVTFETPEEENTKNYDINVLTSPERKVIQMQVTKTLIVVPCDN